jgi:cytochrome P450
MAGPSAAPSFDLLGAEARPDPYPHYERLRRETPVYWDSARQSWVVLRYRDAAALLKSPEVAHWEQPGGGPLAAALGSWLGQLDPRQGGRLRSLVAPVFTPRAMAAWRERLEQRAEELLAEAAAGLDIVNDFAEPFTLCAAAHLLGIPDRDEARFAELARGTAGSLLEALGGGGRLEEEALRRVERLAEFLIRAVASKQGAPGNDLLSAVGEAEEAEWLPFLAFFLFASHENMMNFIGNAVRTLVLHPEALARLRNHPAMLPAAVEELLRFDSPVQFSMIRLRSDVMVEQERIRAGEPVMVGVGSANRDAEEFANPDSLELTRERNRHLSFGAGPLQCMGAGIARLEGQIALQALTRRMIRPVMPGPFRWRRSPAVLRGLECLAVQWGGERHADGG